MQMLANSQQNPNGFIQGPPQQFSQNQPQPAATTAQQQYI
jgi:hypothetical protein